MYLHKKDLYVVKYKKQLLALEIKFAQSIKSHTLNSLITIK